MRQTSWSGFSPLSRLAGTSCLWYLWHISYHRQVNEQEFDIKYAQAEFVEMTALLSRVNVRALRDRAAALRKVDCTVPELSYDHGSRFSIMGGMNYHIPVNFVDGVTWLCRIRRRNITSTPLAHQNRLILSEAATYRFLSSRTQIPVPEIHDWAIDSPSNPIGVGYILMDKLVGKPLSAWNLNNEDRKRVLRQLADVYIALKQHPFQEIGCLLDPDDLSVGPVLEESTIDADGGNLCLLGPFKSALEYRTTSIKHQIDLILRGESYTDNPVDAYIVHRFILDVIIGSITRNEKGPFFLKHMDDKGDHILVDNDFHIVGIIDWEWAQTTTESEAFAAPLYLLDVNLYYSGSNELSREEVEFASVLSGRNEMGLAECVYGGRVAHRFAHCVGGDTGNTESLPNHFMGLRSALRRNKPHETWEQWRESALLKYKKDEGLQNLIQRGSYE
jgi:Phosphotransferase enzyme family